MMFEDHKSTNIQEINMTMDISVRDTHYVKYIDGLGNLAALKIIMLSPVVNILNQECRNICKTMTAYRLQY